MRAAAIVAAAILIAGPALAGPADQTYYPPDPPPAPPALAGIQYLYGSAEAAGLTRQTWRALVAYDAEAMKARHRKSVVLAPGATLEDPHFVPCGDKPPAAVFDVDETVLLNLGAEYDTLANHRPGFDAEIWQRYAEGAPDKSTATPGAPEALAALRAMGITVIFNTNRGTEIAHQTERALDDAGLGPAVHGKTLYLSGDDATGFHKDGRRWRIAQDYCVLSLAGDQLVDISDQFDAEAVSVPARRAEAALPAVAALWGAGWFVMPNPAYGAGLQGGADDIFPKDKQWRDPGPATRKTGGQ